MARLSSRSRFRNLRIRRLARQRRESRSRVSMKVRVQRAENRLRLRVPVSPLQVALLETFVQRRNFRHGLLPLVVVHHGGSIEPFLKSGKS